MLRRSSRLLRLRTHFDVFAIPHTAALTPAHAAAADRSHALNLKSLQKSLHALQRKFHPDALVGKPAADVASAEAMASEVNTAYAVLHDGYSRTRYVAYCVALFSADESNPPPGRCRSLLDACARSGRVLDEAEDIKLGERLDDAFLERMMALHEDIDDIDDEDGLSADEKARRLTALRSVPDEDARDAQVECEKSLAAHGAEFFVSRIESFSPNQAAEAGVLSAEATAAQREFLKSMMRWTYARNLQQKILDRL